MDDTYSSTCSAPEPREVSKEVTFGGKGGDSTTSSAPYDEALPAEGSLVVRQMGPRNQSLTALRSNLDFESMDSDAAHSGAYASCRSCVRYLLRCVWVQTLSACAIVLTLVITCIETDRAANRMEIPEWVHWLSWSCFALYALEFMAIAFVDRHQVLADNPHLFFLDGFVILLGLADLTLHVYSLELHGPFQMLRFVRFFRLLHLLGTSFVKQHMRELRKLVMMMTSSFKTLFWSFLFCFLVMTLWSTLAVGLLHQRMQEMVSQDPELWQECERCKRAFASVMDANLTFFQTIVAGDSWGRIAVPVIEMHPWSAVIFVGALMTLVYGVLGLIVAVIVDMFADLRAKDVSNIASDLEQDESDQKYELLRLFQQIDANRDGYVSLPEILRAANKVQKFKSYLRILGIEKDDLRELYESLDKDCSGTVEPGEFVEAMYSMMRGGPAVTRMPSIHSGIRRDSSWIHSGSGSAVGHLDSMQGAERQNSPGAGSLNSGSFDQVLERMDTLEHAVTSCTNRINGVVLRQLGRPHGLPVRTSCSSDMQSVQEESSQNLDHNDLVDAIQRALEPMSTIAADLVLAGIPMEDAPSRLSSMCKSGSSESTRTGYNSSFRTATSFRTASLSTMPSSDNVMPKQQSGGRPELLQESEPTSLLPELLPMREAGCESHGIVSMPPQPPSTSSCGHFLQQELPPRSSSQLWSHRDEPSMRPYRSDGAAHGISMATPGLRSL